MHLEEQWCLRSRNAGKASDNGVIDESTQVSAPSLYRKGRIEHFEEMEYADRFCPLSEVSIGFGHGHIKITIIVECHGIEAESGKPPCVLQPCGPERQRWTVSVGRAPETPDVRRVIQAYGLGYI